MVSGEHVTKAKVCISPKGLEDRSCAIIFLENTVVAGLMQVLQNRHCVLFDRN